MLINSEISYLHMHTYVEILPMTKFKQLLIQSADFSLTPPPNATSNYRRLHEKYDECQDEAAALIAYESE